jgi:hypothetical protein
VGFNPRNAKKRTRVNECEYLPPFGPNFLAFAGRPQLAFAKDCRLSCENSTLTRSAGDIVQPNTMRILKLLALVILGLAWGDLAVAQPNARSHAPRSGTLTGSVYAFNYESNDSLLPNAKVIVKGAGLTKTTETDTNGRFSFELPPGVYELSTEIPNWYPARRGQFEVRSGETAVINLAPRLRVETIALQITSSGLREPATFVRRPKYEFYTLPRSQNKKLKLLFEFSAKQSRRGGIYLDVATASYNVLSIYGDRLRYRPGLKILEAKGQVVVDDGKTRVNATFVSVDFSTGAPVLRIGLGPPAAVGRL